ncbi:MAG: ribonuclease G [Flavobacteriales bacterium]
METELILQSGESEVNIALLKGGRLFELHSERDGNSYKVGDLYLGKVRKLVPSLNAAFVDVGYEKDAFLHYLDLGPQIESLNKYIKRTTTGKQTQADLADFTLEKDIPKDGTVNQILKTNQNVLVQIAKEPISTKGPRLSGELSLAGRFIVLVPFSDRISVSQKIRKPEERDRLKRLIASIRPKGFGVIIRTVAEGKLVADLDADLSDLVQKWHQTFKKLQGAKPPFRLLGELNRTSSLLRDILNDSFNQIAVDDADLYDELRQYLRSIAPDKEKIVKLYKGRTSIFDYYGVNKQIKGAFGRSVGMPKGSYLIIEHTEALHVIDVNSGNRANKTESQAENALAVNLQAATEIARQLRLRDMGGIVVIDFIDMHLADHRKMLFERLKEEMKGDRAKHKILPPSRFGLIELTRQRVRPEMNIKTVEKCPSCHGTGEVEASILITDNLDEKIHDIFENNLAKKVTVGVHPYIAAYLTNGMKSIRMKWFFKYKKWITVRPMSSYHTLEYRFFDEKDEEVVIDYENKK